MTKSLRALCALGVLTCALALPNVPAAQTVETCSSVTLSRTMFWAGEGVATWWVKVTTPTPTCSWTATIDRGPQDSSPWLLLEFDPARLSVSGTGPGQFVLSTVISTLGKYRYGQLVVPGQTYKVTQEGYDRVNPIVELSGPISGSSLTGVVQIGATASDNVVVKGVRFQVDGQDVAAERTAAPYQVSWDTTMMADGSHTVTAIARDGAGNTASASIQVTVQNVPATEPPDEEPPSGPPADEEPPSEPPPTNTSPDEPEPSDPPPTNTTPSDPTEPDPPTNTSPTEPTEPPNPGTPLKRLRMVTWNVQFGYTLTNKHDLPSQAELLASLNPDVIVLQEVTLADTDMPAYFEQKLEQLTGKAWTRLFTQMVTDAGKADSQGNIVFTWLPVDEESSHVVCAVPGDQSPPAQSSCASFVRYALTVNAVQLQFVGVHLNYPNLAYRTFQLQELTTWLDTLGPNRIIAGDFNMEPGDALWPDWLTKYADVWAGVTGSTGEPGYTKDKRSATGLPGRIDYMFIPAGSPHAHIGVQQMAVIKTVLSDHHLLLADYIVRH